MATTTIIARSSSGKPDRASLEQELAELCVARGLDVLLVSDLCHIAESNWLQDMQGSLTKGVAYLVGRVEDGMWTESAPIGPYFAGLWYSEELCPVIRTVEALGRTLRALYSCERERRRVRPAARTMEGT